MSTDQSKCVVCARQMTPRFMCVDCTGRLVDMLTDLPAYYAISAAEYWPQGGGGGGKSSETPLGLRVDALDGRASRVALETLESWERCLREEFTPTQDADLAQRERKAAAWGAAHSDDLHGVTLCGVVDWLVHNAERIAVEFVAVDELYAEVKALHRIAARAAREPQPDVTVISCPADADAGLCGASLRLTGEFVCCPRCSTEWSRPRLLLVARSVDADVWQPAGVVSEHLGVPERTLRHWAQHGHIKRRGSNLLWSSVVAHIGRVEDVG